MSYTSIEKRRAYHSAWAKKNAARRQELNAAWQAKRLAWYNEFKKDLACKVCGENHPACIQFHHRDGADKIGSISNLSKSWSEKRIMSEMEKCDVLCANCHAKLHYEKRNK